MRDAEKLFLVDVISWAQQWEIEITINNQQIMFSRLGKSIRYEIASLTQGVYEAKYYGSELICSNWMIHDIVKHLVVGEINFKWSEKYFKSEKVED